MDSKKKPPPGATLISRLREGRLKREQALAERRQAGEQGEAANSGGEQTVHPEAPPAEDSPPSAATASGRRAQAKRQAAPQAPEAIDIQAVPLPEASSGGESEPAVARVPAGSRSGGGLASQAGSLIRRSISLADLRPVNDDYDLLTEEIRLAGRFAAAGLIAQGLRLKRLKEADIYKEHYQTFEDYCRKEHTMSATYAYRLIRMSEMAERLSQGGAAGIAGSDYAESMPDPFEAMLGLGHRHLLALLPLTTDTAQELLVRGVPVAGQQGGERIPIVRATEQQIRQALKVLMPQATEKPAKRKQQGAPPARSVRTLADMVDLLKDWAEWLESEPDARALSDRVGEGREKSRLAQRLRTLSERILAAL